MITIDVRDGLKQLTKDLTFISQKQIPYATALAINETAIVAQNAVQASLHSHFIIRGRTSGTYGKTWLERTIKFLLKPNGKRFATKGDLEVILGIDPKRDLLSKFQTGGTKVGLRSRLAIPIGLLNEGNPMAILAKQRRLASYGLHREKGRIIGNRGTFIAGHTVLQRDFTGVKGMSGKGSRVRVLFSLVKSVPIPKRLYFYEIAPAMVNAQFANQFALAFKKAAKSSRTQGEAALAQTISAENIYRMLGAM